MTDELWGSAPPPPPPPSHCTRFASRVVINFIVFTSNAAALYTKISLSTSAPLGKNQFYVPNQITTNRFYDLPSRARLLCRLSAAVALLTEMGRSATPAPLCGTRACLCPGLLRCDDCQLSIISIYNVITHFNLDVYITSNERDSSPLRRWIG